MSLSRIQSQSIYKLSKRRKPKKLSRLDTYAKELNKNLPASEQWFQSLWVKDVPQSKKKFYQDKYNNPYGKYIPDVINLGYKYIIEVDGSIHNEPDVILKDIKKQSYYENKGFKVFRIKAYDKEAYSQLLIQVQEYKTYTGCR